MSVADVSATLAYGDQPDVDLRVAVQPVDRGDVVADPRRRSPRPIHPAATPRPARRSAVPGRRLRVGQVLGQRQTRRRARPSCARRGRTRARPRLAVSDTARPSRRPWPARRCRHASAIDGTVAGPDVTDEPALVRQQPRAASPATWRRCAIRSVVSRSAYDSSGWACSCRRNAISSARCPSRKASSHAVGHGNGFPASSSSMRWSTTSTSVPPRSITRRCRR